MNRVQLIDAQFVLSEVVLFPYRFEKVKTGNNQYGVKLDSPIPVQVKHYQSHKPTWYSEMYK